MDASTGSRAGRAFAWLGGAAFASSLAYFVYFYTVVLDVQSSRASRSTLAAVIQNLALFGAFGIHHSVMARPAVKRRLTEIVPPSLERAIYVWVSSILFFLVCRLWTPVPGGEVYRMTGWLVWLSRGVQLLGLLLIALSTRVLDPLELAGIRQASGKADAPEFKIIGPYRWVRHPLYLGWMLFVFGASPMTADRLVLAAVSTAYLFVAMPLEERSLAATFGDAYGEYTRSVRWRVLPGVY